MYGTVAELRSAVQHEDVPDHVLVERVRSKMGRYVSHPSSIDVNARDGQVTLEGVVLAHELDDLLSAVASVSGVKRVENRLEAHKTPENIPGLQGGVRRSGEPAEVMQEYWSPATRLVVGAAGMALMGNCLARRTPGAIVFGTVGFGLFTRALANVETKRLFGVAPGRRGFDLQKTITIEAPVEKVFALLADKHNYPRFTDIVKSVRDVGEGRYQKTLAGPGGTEVVLDEVITRRVPNEYLAFRSGPNSMIKYAGRARFVALGDTSAQVQLDLTYNPPGGVISHSAARVAGYDPKSLLDDVLMRAKSYLETGKQPHDAAEETPVEAVQS